MAQSSLPRHDRRSRKVPPGVLHLRGSRVLPGIDRPDPLARALAVVLELLEQVQKGAFEVHS